MFNASAFSGLTLGKGGFRRLTANNKKRCGKSRNAFCGGDEGDRTPDLCVARKAQNAAPQRFCVTKRVLASGAMREQRKKDLAMKLSLLVEMRGIEPLTYALRTHRSTN